MCKILLQLTLLSIFLINYVNAQAKVVGGTAVPISQAPYVVNIRETNTGSLICGGTLITSKLVTSAANCLKGKYTIKQLTIQGGASFFSETGYRRTADLLVFPTAFDTTTYNHDVCVLRLKTAMPSSLTPVQIAYNGVSLGESLKIYGWGLTTEDGTPSNVLQTTTITPVAKAECRLSYELTGTMFCAAAPGKDACRFDGGGPAINANNKMVGIVSWGYGCARADYPGVYTSIAKTGDFIKMCISRFG
ncbi:trypsin alpha-3-like [Teleopsis dalmanni]|uniref:trypsin alpha-3-like n=1 Tax=Teleopsis dalmanni TaxID=139649 RepID=UPI0018CF93E8|nr:trypsin alpha-3-like [Teleopsis dalmanni]